MEEFLVLMPISSNLQLIILGFKDDFSTTLLLIEESYIESGN